MKRIYFLLIALLLLVSLSLTACSGGDSAEEPAAGGDDTAAPADSGAAESAGAQTAVIGFTASQTGKYNVESISPDQRPEPVDEASQSGRRYGAGRRLDGHL